MQTRPLGRTGIDVSEIGFGAWGIGGATPGATSYGARDDAESLAALDRALAEGITFFDTSSVYGYGHSEALIGRAFAGRRERVVIATKAGFTRYDAAPDHSPASLRRSLEGSLERLGTDHVDLLQLHNAPIEQLRQDPDILATLQALRAEGRIRAFGLSIKTMDEGVAAIRDFAVPVLQLNLNMMDLRAIDSGLLELAEATGTGIIARTPLCFGFLAGTLSPDAEFAADDHRSAWPRAQIRAWAEGAALTLGAVADRPGQNGVVKALRFCLSYPAVSTVIPGLLRPAEVSEAAAAGRFGALSRDERASVEALNRSYDFLVRRAKLQP
ncbi:aldo/keto reductase [Magnetospirillum sp. UT-4]|uniref:aldo/keto reductase n=1 Tax=Magnetospirillum sp. UT-4 TaxID=2681467 RepID=UPI00137DF47C|nr:aldo/keto reductase [Magnetospirillum sp. UT-4]CAA7618458.1 conserved hypothetical protein [Magnetospirillum sp. UT-4]